MKFTVMAKRPVNGSVQEVNGLDHLKFIIPAKKNRASIVFYSIWLIGWLIGQAVVLEFVLFENDLILLFPILFLVFWTFGAFWVIWTLLWQFLGKETISLYCGQLALQKVVFGLGSKKEYALKELKNLSVNHPTGNQIFHFNSHRTEHLNKLKFDYGNKTIKFAYEIGEDEANYILEKMEERWKMER